MILGQLVLLAAQIAQWAFFAPEVIPLAVTGARIAVKMILRGCSSRSPPVSR